MIDFRNKVDTLSYRKKFETTISCVDSNSLIPDEELINNDLQCQLVCNISDFLSQPTENAVGVCNGVLFDLGPDNGIKIGVLNAIEY